MNKILHSIFEIKSHSTNNNCRMAFQFILNLLLRKHLAVTAQQSLLFITFTFVNNTGIFGSQNSAITCLHAPHGEIGPSVSPVITK